MCPSDLDDRAAKVQAHPSVACGSSPYSGAGESTGFRGIGGDLLKTYPSIASSGEISSVPVYIAVHGSHLVSPIQQCAEGERVASCPVCLTQTELSTTSAGWVTLNCTSCGSEFIASDGSPPPEALSMPAEMPTVHSPLSMWASEWVADPPPGVRTDPDGRWFVLCPNCLELDVAVPKRFTDEITLDCPRCRGSFIVSYSHPPEASWLASGSLPELPPLPLPPRPAVPIKAPKPLKGEPRSLAELRFRGTPGWELLVMFLVALPILISMWLILVGPMMLLVLNRFLGVFRG